MEKALRRARQINQRLLAAVHRSTTQGSIVPRRTVNPKAHAEYCPKFFLPQQQQQQQQQQKLEQSDPIPPGSPPGVKAFSDGSSAGEGSQGEDSEFAWLKEGFLEQFGEQCLCDAFLFSDPDDDDDRNDDADDDGDDGRQDEKEEETETEIRQDSETEAEDSSSSSSSAPVPGVERSPIPISFILRGQEWLSILRPNDIRQNFVPNFYQRLKHRKLRERGLSVYEREILKDVSHKKGDSFASS